MIRLILFLVAVAALALVGSWIAESPGSVVLRWQGWEVRTSVAVLMVGLVLAVALLTALVELWRWMRKVPARIADHRHRTREVRGYRELALGLVAAAAGDPADARIFHRRAEKLLGNSAATLLLAAQAAQLEGHEDVAERKFHEMLKSPETEFLGLRGLLAQAMKAGDMEAALRLAERAHARRPQTPWVLQTLFDLQARTGRWREALATVKDMYRFKLLDRPALTRRRGILSHMEAGRLRERSAPSEALGFAKQAAQLLPGFAPAAIQASDLARAQERHRLARKLLERAWSAMPHPALAKAYAALVPDETPAARLARFERLYDLQPNHAETHLTLAELALAAKDHERARGHLERAAAIRPTARLYRLFAELERAASGDAGAINRWLGKAMEAEADPAWVCESTGVVLPRWSVFGPGGEFDSVAWMTPPLVAAMMSDDRPRVLLTGVGDPLAPSPTQAPATSSPATPSPATVDARAATA